MKLENIDTLTLRALSKALADELKGRDELTVGVHTVDENVNLHVSANITKGEDETYTPTIKISHKVAMALLVQKCGFVGKGAINALQAAMTEAMNADDKSESYIRAMSDIQAAEKQLATMLGKLPKATRTGKAIIKVKVD